MAVKIVKTLGKDRAPYLENAPEQTTYEVSYAGAVLDTGEMNFHDDSDFYAVVWDEATQSIRRVEYASTRGWTYANSATVDATEEVLAKAEAALARYMADSMRGREERAAEMPAKGRRVKVVKGRKVAVGTEGMVIWLGKDRFDQSERYRSPYAGMFGPDKFGKRVGIKLDSGEVVWTAATNVDVIEPEQYLTSETERAVRAAAQAKARNWRWVGSLAA